MNRKEKKFWRVLQAIFYLIGLVSILLLLNDSFRFLSVLPQTFGRDWFWNVLIFIAPLVFALLPGFWRNICPLGTMSLLPLHYHFSKRHKQSLKQQSNFYLYSIILLYLIVPLRHVETSGLAVAITLIIIALSALLMGYIYQGKSGWCSGLCPVLPVEKLYGIKPLVTLNNAHCAQCINCISPCLDANQILNKTAHISPHSLSMTHLLFVGSFPGFVWGWFQVNDFAQRMDGWQHLGAVYSMPLTGALITLVCFMILKRELSTHELKKLILFFTASAISCYYYYRVPSVLGMTDSAGVFGIDFSDYAHYTRAIQLSITLFFFWWFFARDKIVTWGNKPVFPEKEHLT